MRVNTKNIDDYIGSCEPEIRARMHEIRALIQKACPEAQEAVKYGMPTFTFNGNLIHFAAYKKHIGLYPAMEGKEAFNKKLSAYRTSKNTVQILHDQPLPTSLISQLVKLRMKHLKAKHRAG